MHETVAQHVNLRSPYRLENQAPTRPRNRVKSSRSRVTGRVRHRYHRPMLSRIARVVFWRTLALVCVLLGAIGVLVPVLPTVPFLLVAAWAGGKGWPQLEAWLLAHPRYGAEIQRWRDHRAVPRRAKWLASVTMLASIALIIASTAPLWAKIGVPAFVAAVAGWLWMRPET